MEISGKTAVFSGRIWPDWGNTARADMAGLGSIGLRTGTENFTLETLGVT